MKITDALLAEHVVFHNLFDYLERCLPQVKTLGEIRTLSSLLESMMLIHSKMEDDLLFDPLEAAFSQMGQADNFHEEHEEIENALHSVQAVGRITEAKKRLLNVVLLSRRHFDKEERIVFPLAEKQLSAKSLLALGKRWEDQRDGSGRAAG